MQIVSRLFPLDDCLEQAAIRLGSEDGGGPTGVRTPQEAIEARARERARAKMLANALLRRVGAAGSFRRDVARRPVWPEGFVGSITHTNSIVAAAVGRRRDVRSVGLDSEAQMSEEAARDVMHMCVVADERRYVTAADGGIDARRLTLIFSAKEAFYKCLRPVVGAEFDFVDAAVVDLSAHRIRIELRKDLSPQFVRGVSLEGSHSCAYGHVHVAFVWRSGVSVPIPKVGGTGRTLSYESRKQRTAAK
jgi:enterobactin synthetase component D